MSDQEYEVEAILDVKSVGRSKHYLVKWKGFADEDNTWEPAANLQDFMIQQFNDRKGQRGEEQPSKRGRAGREEARVEKPDKRTLKKAINDQLQFQMPQKQLVQGGKKEVMIGSNSIASLLQNKKMEKDYYQALQEMQESQKALFMTSAYYKASDRGDENHGLRDWAIGSFDEYGDQPFQVLGVKVVTEEDSMEPVKLYLVDWKIRNDGFKPVRSYICEDELTEADPRLLASFLEKNLTCYQIK